VCENIKSTITKHALKGYLGMYRDHSRNIQEHLTWCSWYRAAFLACHFRWKCTGCHASSHGPRWDSVPTGLWAGGLLPFLRQSYAALYLQGITGVFSISACRWVSLPSAVPGPTLVTLHEVLDIYIYVYALAGAALGKDIQIMLSEHTHMWVITHAFKRSSLDLGTHININRICICPIAWIMMHMRWFIGAPISILQFNLKPR